MKKIFFAVCTAVCFAIGAGSSGCSSAPADPRVTMHPKIKSDIVVSDVRFSRNASNFLTCQATMTNTTSGPVNIEWKTQWIDAQGMECDNVGSAWRRTCIQPGESKGLQNTSLSTSAADMKIYIRPLK